FGRECRRCEVWRDDDGYPAADQIGRQFRQPIIVIVRPEVFDGHVLALDIASFAEPFSECCDKICAPFGRTTEEKPDHWPRRLLRVRRDRPRSRAAEQRDELASPHSITSSARASSVGGTVRPSALAVVRFTTKSNLVGCSTGISAGFAPRRTLFTTSAARLHMFGQFGP